MDSDMIACGSTSVKDDLLDRFVGVIRIVFGAEIVPLGCSDSSESLASQHKSGNGG